MTICAISTLFGVKNNIKREGLVKKMKALVVLSNREWIKIYLGPTTQSCILILKYKAHFCTIFAILARKFAKVDSILSK